MTGGGLLVLIAYGSQNVLLSGNPQMIYYYKIFKRYSHFSMENVSISLDGPNQLQYDQPIQLRAKIQRIADLMSDMYFSFRLPDIYSHYITPNPGGRVSQFEFQWSRYIGAAIIQRVAFFIGGQKIQEFDGTYLLAKAQLEYDTDTYKKWQQLVGDTNELNNPSNGSYASQSKTGYPTVIRDPKRSDQLNRPSILGQDVHVPLNFWFTDATSQALPIVALQYQDCEVQITLNPINKLYSILDASGFRVAPGFIVNSPINTINANTPAYGIVQDVSGEIRNFLVDIGYTPPTANTWFINPRIQCTFVYLSEVERTTFATRPLTYIFPQVSYIPYEGIYQSRQTFDLDIHNPITRLIFITRRSDSTYRNDFNNFTNWYTYPYAPFSATDVEAYLQSGNTSGLLIPNSQKDILRSVRILCDGNEIQEQKPIDFFSKINPYRYTSGFTNSEVPIYTWALTSSKIQPSGSLNASRVRNLQGEFEFHTLPPATNYTYNLSIYVESINFLVIASGSGAPKYAL
jgi:hypothetical protein